VYKYSFISIQENGRNKLLHHPCNGSKTSPFAMEVKLLLELLQNVVVKPLTPDISLIIIV